VGQNAVVVRNYLYRGLARLRSAILERTDAARLVSAQPPTAQPAAEQKALLIPEPGLP
jgi:hypothetical protein